MENIDINKVLPQHLSIMSLDNHLYRIGLCITPYGSNKRRAFINTPIIVFINVVIYWFKFIACILITNEFVLRVLADFAHFMAIRVHFNLAALLFTTSCILIQITYYYNYRNGVKPTFLRVFQMMSGSKTPKSVGLTNQTQIFALIRRTRILYKIIKLNNERIIPIMAFSLIILTFAFNTSLNELLMFGIPNAFIFMVIAYHMYNIYFFQSFYFYILCYYVRIKTKAIKSKLMNIFKQNNYTVQNTIASYNRIYAELIDYNDSFWSKFLLYLWLIMGSIISNFIYIVLFVPMDIYYKLIWVYVSIIWSTLFMFIIFTASAINYEINNSYKIINSFMAHNSHINRKTKHTIYASTKIKVSFLLFYSKYLIIN